MPQYRRIGHNFTTFFDSPPSPDHWEPVEDKPEPKPAKAADPKES